jgi:uncharacterized repeat protein (TIGR03806 family)
MKKLYVIKTLLFLSLFTALFSCGSDNADDYKEVSPVVVDLTAVPYARLSDYKFFEGEMKNLIPAYKVLPYDLNSSLFTDYAHKKRFVWMPEGVKATYSADTQVLNFPTGAVLIKNFYYDNVQPDNTTRIIETRLMIKKADGWIFANYVWNDAQTEANLDMNGSYTPISWNQDGTIKSSNYRIPSEVECHTCHKTNGSVASLIGPKPQNLNKNYTYADGPKNQLSKWIEEGYLSEEGMPSSIVSTVDWTDVSQPLELRVRSYLDINCAHCHKDGSHCDYRSMRFAFSETTIPDNLGICIPPDEIINSSLTYIVTKKNSLRSVLSYRIKSVNPSQRMPLLGRTVVHEEAVAMIEEWINSMDSPCP